MKYLWMLSSSICLCLLVRFVIGNWSYSGFRNPPMYGDFEAQRHWMEITIELPIGDWYRNTTQNDLYYWGLDYPPLTAYTSWLCGQVASYVHPPLVQFQISRGHESEIGKLFMRTSVIVLEALVYFPAIILWCFRLKHTNRYGSNSKIMSTEFILLLSIPSLLLIDHGHFQYNSVCLGLALLGAYFVDCDQDILGSVLFCLSLNFKQMALYYSPVFFFCLLRKSFSKRWNFITPLAKIGVTVILSFSVLWLPFCLFPSFQDSESCFSSLAHVLSRLFPFSRGIFEDKVSNVWYTLSVVIDIRQIFPSPVLIRLSLILTTVLLLPTIYDLLAHPLTTTRLLLALCNSSLAFFLSSFQVHEKSLLLVLAPASLLLHQDLLLSTWFQVFGCFTMFPLLVRDGLAVPYFALIIIYTCLSLCNSYIQSSPSVPFTDNDEDFGIGLGLKAKIANNLSSPSRHKQDTASLLKVVFVAGSTAGMVALHLLHAFVPAPPRYPDLYPALFSIFGACNLVVVFLHGVYLQYTIQDRSDKSKTI